MPYRLGALLSILFGSLFRLTPLATVALVATHATPVFAQPAQPARPKPAGVPAPHDAPVSPRDARDPRDARRRDEPQDLVQKGQLQYEEQQYEESVQTLSAALLRPSNTKAQKVEIYRGLALDYITLGRKDEAENAVRGLLVQQPDYQIPAAESPRFRDFFAQSRAKWEAEGRPGIVKDELAAKPVLLRHSSPTQVDSGKSLELHAHLDDPEARAGSVRLFYRSGNKGDFTPVSATVDGAAVRATLPGAAIKAPVVDYYFEVLDNSGAVIASRGDAGSPLRLAVPDGSKGWVLPVAIGGGVLGAAAIVGALALAGVFKSNSAANGGRESATVNISIHESAR